MNGLSSIEVLTGGYRIIISDLADIVVSSKQRRKHRKKRINKKWRKRYGFTYIYDRRIIMDHENRSLIMSRVTYEALKQRLQNTDGGKENGRE